MLNGAQRLRFDSNAQDETYMTLINAYQIKPLCDCAIQVIITGLVRRPAVMVCIIETPEAFPIAA